MPARILVVDDLPINLRLMQAQLSEEYYEVLLAGDGMEALDICRREMVDLVLLDVMMPGLDGYEVCRRLKADPATMHIPVVLVTALDQRRDRVAGLEAGADDFLTKPVRELALLSRIRSLTRLKILNDELRMRAETTMQIASGRVEPLDEGVPRGGHLCAFLDDPREALHLERLLSPQHLISLTDGTGPDVREGFDLFLVDLQATGFDPLRLLSRLRSAEATRQTPILLLAASDDETRIVRGLDLGANDYCQRPLDRHELLARIRTQLKRKRYDEALRRSLQATIEMATLDALTGLHNRRFLDTHLDRAVAIAAETGKPLCLLILDVDHFKAINDGFGHDVGDEVLRQVAGRLRASVRASDLACRMGGEEFAVLMPDADLAEGRAAAERLRLVVEREPFSGGEQSVAVTTSVGLALALPGDGARELMRRADRGLYEAKATGRNKVVEYGSDGNVLNHP